MALRKCVHMGGRSLYIDMTPEEETAFNASRKPKPKQHRLTLAERLDALNARVAALEAGGVLAPIPVTPVAPETIEADPPPPDPPAPEPAVMLLDPPPDDPPPEIIPAAPALPPAPGSFDLREVFARVDAPEETDEQRRVAARARLQAAVEKAAQSMPGGQVRYDLALQAHNGNVRAMGLLADEAAIKGRSVADLAASIIAERQGHEDRMMRAHAVLARVLAEVDHASGPAIDEAAMRGVAEIEGMS